MTRIELTHKSERIFSVVVYADRAERFAYADKRDGVRLYLGLTMVATIYMESFRPFPELDRLCQSTAKSKAAGI